jgi:hypothetical protein
MARLEPAQTFFLAGYDFIWRTDAAILVRFALASPAERRSFILGDDDGDTQLQAA